MKQWRNNQTVNLILDFFFTSNPSLCSNSDDNSQWSEDRMGQDVDSRLDCDHTWSRLIPERDALRCSSTTQKCFPTSLGIELNHFLLHSSFAPSLPTEFLPSSWNVFCVFRQGWDT